MNKYLLLRDNKQSGPYTVPEIVQMGLKPYDLVWLEGKSAAWRYPSEIEDLKAYAPAVEEQPFDRFYKKPEAKKAETLASTPVAQAVSETKAENATGMASSTLPTHEKYLPKVSQKEEEEKSTKKVYINFPATASSVVATGRPHQNTSTGNNQSSVADVSQQIAKTTKLDLHTVEPVLTTSPSEFSDTNEVAQRWAEKKTAYNMSQNTRNFSDSIQTQSTSSRPAAKLLPFAIAACVLLGIVSGILLFNYYRQQQALSQLNALVQQIEENKKQAAVTASIVPEPASASSTPQQEVVAVPTTQVPETLSQQQSDYNVPEKQPVSTRKKPVDTENKQPVVFVENSRPGERPVERRDDQEKVTVNAEPASSPENLFKLVDVKPNDYKTGLLGGISNLKFELTNKSSVELQRVAVEVKYLGPEKKVVKKQTIYFENVSPGAHSTIEVPKSNRGVSIEYTVTDIKS